MNRKSSILLVALALTSWLACAPAAPAPRAAHATNGLAAPGTPESVDIVKAREKNTEQSFTWAPYAASSFEKAKKENRYILIDGAAEWCHWCHVMDETTYRDPEVGRILRERFVTIRVDIDERPDIAERYADWGWPATILLSPAAEELGKFRGYLPPEKLLATLRDIEKMGAMVVAKADTLDSRPATVGSLGWIAARVGRDMDAFYDPKEGGWGDKQKAPIGGNVEFEVIRARHGDAAAGKRVIFTLQKQHRIIDPVWGGVYQYSAGSDWNDPHFEKLMVVQAASLEAYARAYDLTKDAALLADAKAIARYMESGLGAPDGAFYVNQDADVGAHDRTMPFVDGHVYYAKDDAGRRALGTPWVDTHIYGRENGLAIAALCALYEVTKDKDILARARQAADAIVATHLLDDGTVLHDAMKRTAPFFLADAAAMARALARLSEVSGDTKYRDRALKLATAMVTNFEDAKTGGLWESTVDGAAAGVFGRRERSFSHNVVAARAFAVLARITADLTHRDRARKILAAVASPRGLDEQGRWVGEFLVALDEAAAFTF